MTNRDLLIQIDTLIENCDKNCENIDLILELCSKYIEIEEVNLFSDSLKSVQKKFIVAVLIRICGINENLVWSLPDRHKIFSLIRSTLEPDFKTFDISDKDLKDNSLLLIKIREIESKFKERSIHFKNGIVNLNSLIKLPMNLLRFKNHKTNLLFIDSFCDSNIFNPDSLNKIFEQTNNLSSEDVKYRIEAQQQLIKLISTYLAELKKNDRTIIEQITIISFLERAINILQDNLPEEHKIRTAELTIEKVERKYPLNKPNEPFEIKFKIINSGGGEAQNTVVCIKSKNSNLKIITEEIHVGEIQTHTTIISKAKCLEAIDTDSIQAEIEVSWSDFEGRNRKGVTEISLLKQKSDINWNDQRNPYSLDAVKGKDDFIGRKEIIKRILSNYEKETFESSIITGQKRVGKSSIGRAIESLLSDKEKYIVIYLSINELDNQRAETFINSFGETLYSELKFNFDKLEYRISDASFDGSLYPLLKALTKLKKDLSLRKDDYKIIFIIDEFDEIPIQVINNTDIGNAFFQNIRSLIDKREYTEFLGLILIGGENMRFIHQNTQRLNKFNLLYVDYFDKEKYWNDFVELVTKPAKDIIEYSPEILNQLYELTEGNPFYTNLLCKHLFDYGITNKISYLTDTHLDKILSEKLVEMGTLHFSHFWLDNILEEDRIKKDNLETQRRKLLIAYAQLKRENKQITDKNLNSLKILENVSIPKILESFVNRGIFISMNSQEYRFKPKFAEKWLIEIGSNELISSFTNEEAVQVYIQNEKSSYVSDKEIQTFIEVNNLTAYRSRPLEISHIRDWLNQFDDNQERRLIFDLLNKIKYYDDFKIREKIRLIHKRINKDLPPLVLSSEDVHKRDRQRKDVIVSGFDKLGKSTPLYARIYRQENEIVSRNILFSNKLKAAINSQKISAIIFIDDIIGSGGTIIKEMRIIDEEIGQQLADKKIKIFITAVVGFEKGIENINKELSNLKFPIEVYCPDGVAENETCNAENSILYKDKAEQEKTIEVLKKYYQRFNINSNDFGPFGYNNDGLLVAFNEACPNNTIPLIWMTEDNKWNALLKR